MASRRGYLTQDELAEYANITITNTQEADDQISQAEELIDAYVGPQESYLPSSLAFGTGRVAYDGYNPGVFVGRVSNVNSGAKSFKLTTLAGQTIGRFAGVEVRVLGGTGVGKMGYIVSSDQDGTMVSNIDLTIDNTSTVSLRQLGKFPRVKDVYADGTVSPTVIYKQIPEAVRRATAAQVQFMINMGDDFFAGDESNLQSESMGGYSYSKAPGTAAGVNALIAPKAKALLRGIKSRVGRIV